MLAVLPCRNLSGDDPYADFGDGMTQEIIHRVRRKPLSDLEAYAAVLCFYEYLEDFSVANHARTRAALERAVERDPGYAEAWGCLATVYAGEQKPAGLGSRRSPSAVLDLDDPEFRSRP